MANRACYLKVRQEVHGDTAYPLPFAGFASSALCVEAEAARCVTTLARLLRAGEYAPNVIPYAGSRRRVAPRRSADWRLVHFDQPFEVIHSAQVAIWGGPRFGAMKLSGECSGQRIDDQRTLARAAHSGNTHKKA